jgi:acyl carrier protein
MEATLDTVDRIRTFLVEEVAELELDELGPQTPLLNGMIDSLGLMQLVAYLEEEFGIEIPAGEITQDNFATIGSLGSFVERLAGPVEVSDAAG